MPVFSRQRLLLDPMGLVIDGYRSMLLLFDIVKGGSNGPPTLVTGALSTQHLYLSFDSRSGLTDYATRSAARLETR